MIDSTVTLITGGSRSGKSRAALERISSYSRKAFLATAEVIDPEMARRIERHKKERGPDFLTVEEPLYLAQAVRNLMGQADVILIDCLTFWLNNLFHHFSATPERISKEIQEFLTILDQRRTSLMIVTNEINMGVVPAEALSRRFVDEQGRLNQEVARRSDEVILMISGIPQILKKSETFLER